MHADLDFLLLVLSAVLLLVALVIRLAQLQKRLDLLEKRLNALVHHQDKELKNIQVALGMISSMQAHPLKFRKACAELEKLSNQIRTDWNGQIAVLQRLMKIQAPPLDRIDYHSEIQ